MLGLCEGTAAPVCASGNNTEGSTMGMDTSPVCDGSEQHHVKLEHGGPAKPFEVTVYPGDKVCYEVDEGHGGTCLFISKYPEVYEGEQPYYISPDDTTLQLVVRASAKEGEEFKTKARKSKDENGEPCKGMIQPLTTGDEGGGKVGGGG